MHTSQLSDLIFSDLCVASLPNECWYKKTPDSLESEQLSSEYHDELARLRMHLESFTGTDFKIDWPNSNGFRLRVVRMQVADEKIVFICRRYVLIDGSLNDIGLPPAVVNALLDNNLKNGLVIFLGKTGSGKTTTATSFVRSRLEMYAGVCWTVENPIEIPMQGRHGAGVCYQTEVQHDDDIGSAITKLYRATPNIIFIGELRNGSAIREAIAAGTSGHLVIATFHASDLITGIGRLIRHAQEGNSNVGLEDALRVCIHLSLHNQNATLPGNSFIAPEPKGTGTPPRVLSVEPLWIRDGEEGNTIREMIRNNQPQLLKSELERQLRSFMMRGLP